MANKPITVARQEFMEGLVELINNAQLPAFVMADILKDLQAQLATSAYDQYQRDSEAYQRALKAEEPETEGKVLKLVEALKSAAKEVDEDREE